MKTYKVDMTTQDYANFMRFQAMWEQYKNTYNTEFETARAAIMARQVWGERILRRLIAEEILEVILPESYESADACFESLVKIEELLRGEKFHKKISHISLDT